MTFSDDARRASDGVTHVLLSSAGPLGSVAKWYVTTNVFDDPEIVVADASGSRIRAWHVMGAWIILGPDPDNDWYHLTHTGRSYASTAPVRPFAWERVREWCRHFTEIVGERNA